MGLLPTVEFCGLYPTRLIIGANPFGGFSHQSPQRDAEMIAYYTPERIRETWARAAAAGINTMITNNETPHVLEAVEPYLAEGGALQWIAQVSNSRYPSMAAAVDRSVKIGCKALYFHGGLVDRLYADRDAASLREWVAHARSYGIPIGVAGHAPETHYWVDSLDLVDFHVVCFFNCGSLHAGKGHKFRLADLMPAAECVRRLAKPCIAYKIMAAGRIDPQMAFEYAFENIKPTDVVNVGIHRGDKDDMVEEDVAIVRALLEA
ncbi:MAG: hypothetical protein ACUVX8_13855 [Candidatus Zipacnadales bacterium]